MTFLIGLLIGSFPAFLISLNAIQRWGWRNDLFAWMAVAYPLTAFCAGIAWGAQP